MAAVATQRIRAINDAEISENRIHSDDIARKYGFNAALVSGANVFGYMTQPLVQSYHGEWLSRGIMDVKFLKPTYEQASLSLITEHKLPAQGQRHYLTTACNEDGTVLAKLESWLPAPLPPVNEYARLRGKAAEQSQRPEIAWDLIHLQTPAPPYLWQPSAIDNKQRVDVQRDESPLYRGSEAFIHPYYLLDACNKALMRMFILPAWIHTGSRLVLRQPLRVGQTIEVRAVPIQKWERKGHQFINLYVSMWLDEEVALEVEHNAIFRIAT